MSYGIRPGDIRYEKSRYFRGIRIHAPETCTGGCPFDNPSDHRMKEWPVSLRVDSFSFPLVERLCTHGVGHPDPDSVAYLEKLASPGTKGTWGVHGCCGCCFDPAQESPVKRQARRRKRAAPPS